MDMLITIKKNIQNPPKRSKFKWYPTFKIINATLYILLINPKSKMLTIKINISKIFQNT